MSYPELEETVMPQRQWYAFVADTYEGPFSEDEICQKIQYGEYDAKIRVRKEGLLDWCPLSGVAEFQAFVDLYALGTDAKLGRFRKQISERWENLPQIERTKSSASNANKRIEHYGKNQSSPKPIFSQSFFRKSKS